MPGGSGYNSIVQVDATLKGDVSEAIVIPDLGSAGGMCSEVPRLMVGERVLLFLIAEQRAPEAAQHDPPILHVALVGQGKYRLMDGGAFYEFPTDQGHPPESVGSAHTFITEVAQRVSSPEEELERALTAPVARKSTAPTGFVVLAVVLGAAWISRSRVRAR